MALQTGTWGDSLIYAAISDIGMRRANNQDSHAEVIAGNDELWQSRGHMLLVADGMGGHAAGELASKLAADTTTHIYHKAADLSPPEALEKAILAANEEIYRRGQANPDFSNMGTTISTLVLLPQGALVGHVGDSRVYRLRNSTLEQLTFDHSEEWELREAGKAAHNAELAQLARKNVITRSLGPHPSVKIDFEGPFPIQVGDKYLLCSDGLTGKVRDDELALLLENLEPEAAVAALADLANLRGGPDNITIIVAEATGPAVATQRGAAPPLVVGGKPLNRKASVHPALWIAMGVCFAGSLAMFAAGLTVPGLLALAGGVVAGVAALLILSGEPGAGGKLLGQGYRLGKGPHTKTECDTPALSGRLAQSFETLMARPEANDESLPPLTEVEQHARAARAALDKQDYRTAVDAYRKALAALLRAQRERLKKQASDSSLEL